jgi:hypothetical protein
MTSPLVTEGLVYGTDLGVAQLNTRLYLALQDDLILLVPRPPHEHTKYR